MFPANSGEDDAGTMRIPFAAYADDSTVRGEIELGADRLSDFLAVTDEFQVDSAAFRALDDGRVVEAEAVAILREDLCIVTATGPRGRADLRLWTRQLPVRARVGPYTVIGYLHAPPTIDPLKAAERRQIVALTASVVEYQVGGELARDHAEAVLLNRRKIELWGPAEDADLGLSAAPEVATEVDPRAKDMTAEA